MNSKRLNALLILIFPNYYKIYYLFIVNSNVVQQYRPYHHPRFGKGLRASDRVVQESPFSSSFQGNYAVPRYGWIGQRVSWLLDRPEGDAHSIGVSFCLFCSEYVLLDISPMGDILRDLKLYIHWPLYDRSCCCRCLPQSCCRGWGHLQWQAWVETRVSWEFLRGICFRSDWEQCGDGKSEYPSSVFS